MDKESAELVRELVETVQKLIKVMDGAMDEISKQYQEIAILLRILEKKKIITPEEWSEVKKEFENLKKAILEEVEE